ncbi:hypothetical protein ACFQ3Z_03015 [Streptomyces nogalater]
MASTASASAIRAQRAEGADGPRVRRQGRPQGGDRALVPEDPVRAARCGGRAQHRQSHGHHPTSFSAWSGTSPAR